MVSQSSYEHLLPIPGALILCMQDTYFNFKMLGVRNLFFFTQQSHISHPFIHQFSYPLPVCAQDTECLLEPTPVSLDKGRVTPWNGQFIAGPHRITNNHEQYSLLGNGEYLYFIVL